MKTSAELETVWRTGFLPEVRQERELPPDFDDLAMLVEARRFVKMLLKLEGDLYRIFEVLGQRHIPVDPTLNSQLGLICGWDYFALRERTWNLSLHPYAELVLAKLDKGLREAYRASDWRLVNAHLARLRREAQTSVVTREVENRERMVYKLRASQVRQAEATIAGEACGTVVRLRLGIKSHSSAEGLVPIQGITGTLPGFRELLQAQFGSWFLGQSARLCHRDALGFYWDTVLTFRGAAHTDFQQLFEIVSSAWHLATSGSGIAVRLAECVLPDQFSDQGERWNWYRDPTNAQIRQNVLALVRGYAELDLHLKATCDGMERTHFLWPQPKRNKRQANPRTAEAAA